MNASKTSSDLNSSIQKNSSTEFVEYKPTTLEKSYKYELLTESDLNVNIDLIDPMTYYFNPNDRIQIDSKDEKLLEDESATQQSSKRSQQHRKIVPWMRKTEYISTEFNRYGVGSEQRQEAKVGYSIRKKFGNEQVYKDRESQIAAINQTFTDVKTEVRKHYNKTGVVALEEIPILPDFAMWSYPFAQVVFDADPLPYCKDSKENKLLKATHSVLRGMMDSDGNHFVGYFLPTDSAMQQKLLDDSEKELDKEGVTYKYQLEREYNWTVKNKATKGYEQENYFFVIRDSFVYYNELESRVRLVRRIKKC